VEGSSVTDATTLTVDGLECTVEALGAGPPCLYLHSEFGETGDHPAVIELADAGFHVSAPSLPGFRAGSVPEWDELSHTVYWLGCLLDALDFDDPVAVVGSGLGGWLAAEIAVWFPARVGALTLIAAPGLRIPGGGVAELFREGLDALSALVLPYGGELEELVPPPSATEFDAKRLHLLRALEATARIAWAPYFQDPKLLDRLARVDCPTSVIWGDDDRVVPRAQGEAYAKTIAGASFTVVERTGHLPLLERPADVIEHLAS
jgi:pimeloyl-ACP methyl ester carboxylesterase